MSGASVDALERHGLGVVSVSGGSDAGSQVPAANYSSGQRSGSGEAGDWEVSAPADTCHWYWYRRCLPWRYQYQPGVTRPHPLRAGVARR